MDFLALFQIIAAGLAGTTVGVLHATGADKHKTIAGQVATGLGFAATVAAAVHDSMTVAAAAQPQGASAPAAAQTP